MNRHGTIFHNMRISFSAFNLILYYYVAGFPTHQIHTIVKPLINQVPSLKTIKRYTGIFRSLIHVFIQRYLLTLKLPGPVEIDEACLYRIRKGNNGRLVKNIFWVFGLKCRTTKKIIVYPVVLRTKDILIPFVRLHVPQGSTIYSDRFSSYFNNQRALPHSHLAQYGYRHFGINHSQHFVSEISRSIHTNTIERAWRSLKEKFKHNKPRIEIDQYISEFMFESWIPTSQRYQFMLNLIRDFQQKDS